MNRVLEYFKKLTPKVATWILVCAAAFSAYVLYQRWSSQPWTRDGQVRADIVKITPQVNGYLTKVLVHDNQFVRKGAPIFEIDTRTYQLAVDQGKVALEQARDEVASLQAAVRVTQAQYEEAKVSATSATRKIDSADAKIKSAQASVDQAMAGISSAEQLIKQRNAELSNAKSEAKRAKRLADKKAGSTEDAESTAATVLSKEAQLASAEAGLIQSKAVVTQAEATLNEAGINLLISKDALAESQAAELSAKATYDQAIANLGTPGDENVRVRSAKVSLAQAELDLNRTIIVAPCDGYISNLSVDEGTYAIVGQPLVAIVDSSSFRVHAYFQETKIRHIQNGSVVLVTLMSHPEEKIEGVVEDLGRAVNPPNIAPTEGQPGEVPQIEPTFDWVRLPQRVPSQNPINPFT